MRWVEDIVNKLAKTGQTNSTQDLHITTAADPAAPLSQSYPFKHLLWVPLGSRGPGLDAGLLFARETAWSENEQLTAERLAVTFGHAWCLLLAAAPWSARWLRPQRAGLIAALALAGAAAIPVPMTALAPVEVVARDPVLVTAPIDGQIAEILTEPNTAVTAGQPLVRLVDTQPRNKLQIAEREVIVAEARLQKASQLAFTDARGRHDLGIARAELALRSAEREFAREIMAKTEITAARAGLAVFPDKRELAGKPLQMGDRIMEIADPRHVELKIDLPVADALVIDAGGRVKIFLDSDPLAPLEAHIVHADYRARVAEGRIAAYQVIARFTDNARPPPRIGVRGSAQLFGERVSLGFFLFRRPLSAIRQWVGL